MKPHLNVQRYIGKWVALHPKTNVVVAAGTSLTEARRKAVKQGIKHPRLMIVPKSQSYFVGAA
jgi:hypothetical protein